MQGWLWPIPGYHTVTQAFGHEGHAGIDIGADAGAAIVASRPGTVIFSGAMKDANGEYIDYGEYVKIDDKNGTYTTLYAHMKERKVTSGKHVEAGETIGLADSTGRSTGNHLHFEVRKNGSNVDPWPFIGDAEEEPPDEEDDGVPETPGDWVDLLKEKWIYVAIALAGAIVIIIGIVSFANKSKPQDTATDIANAIIKSTQSKKHAVSG